VSSVESVQPVGTQFPSLSVECYGLELVPVLYEILWK